MQLVAKKASWWTHWDAKQAAVVLPLAAAQVGTLAAAGYLYTRVEQLEGLADALHAPNAAQPVPAASTRLQRVPPPPPPPQLKLTVANALLPVALDSAITLSTIQAGQDFTQIAPSAPNLAQHQPESVPATAPSTALTAKPKLASVAQKTLQKTKVTVKKTNTSPREMPKTAMPAPPVLASAAMQQPEADKTAQANLADLAALTLPEIALPESAAVAMTENSVVAEAVPQKRTTAPVGVSFWVYAGELRATGWHGPRLHHPIDSGLPEIGQRYRTQPIHGLYDAPHGKREMGGYQRGDVVRVEDVQYEPDNNGAVWVKVTKIHSYGHTDR